MGEQRLSGCSARKCYGHSHGAIMAMAIPVAQSMYAPVPLVDLDRVRVGPLYPRHRLSTDRLGFLQRVGVRVISWAMGSPTGRRAKSCTPRPLDLMQLSHHAKRSRSDVQSPPAWTA